MVGLYKDPSGESIKTFQTGGKEDPAALSENGNSSNEVELNKLRRRVLELETNLKRKVCKCTPVQTYCCFSLVTDVGCTHSCCFSSQDL